MVLGKAQSAHDANNAIVFVQGVGIINMEPQFAAAKCQALQ
jgi:hypothetical protein